MTTITAKTGYHHGDLRQQLIQATRALVESKGPDGFSVTEASRAAGVSTAAPYKHFADRTELLQAVALEGYGEMAEAFRQAIRELTPGSTHAITAIGAAYVAYAEANPELFRMMFAFKDKSDEMEQAGLACYALLLRQLADHLGQGATEAEVERAGFPLWTFVHGLSFLRIDGKAGEDRMDGTVPELVDRAVRRLLP